MHSQLDRQLWAASVLNIPLYASDGEAKAAHRDLIAVWHPDHQQSERMKTKAEDACKRINLAYDIFVGRDCETPIPEEVISMPRGETAYGSSWTEQTQPGGHFQHASRTTEAEGNAGCVGGAILGGLVGALFGGFGAIPGAFIGGAIGNSIGQSDRKSGEAVDELGGGALGCIGALISTVFESILGCGCILVVLVVVALIVASLGK